jgi:hypothetical protein
MPGFWEVCIVSRLVYPRGSYVDHDHSKQLVTVELRWTVMVIHCSDGSGIRFETKQKSSRPLGPRGPKNAGTSSPTVLPVSLPPVTLTHLVPKQSYQPSRKMNFCQRSSEKHVY